VSCECELAATRLVVPDLDLVVVSCRHKQWLRGVKSDTTNRAYANRFQLVVAGAISVRRSHTCLSVV
jgi:hypothetical protein